MKLHFDCATYCIYTLYYVVQSQHWAQLSNFFKWFSFSLWTGSNIQIQVQGKRNSHLLIFLLQQTDYMNTCHSCLCHMDIEIVSNSLQLFTDLHVNCRCWCISLYIPGVCCQNNCVVMVFCIFNVHTQSLSHSSWLLQVCSLYLYRIIIPFLTHPWLIGWRMWDLYVVCRLRGALSNGSNLSISNLN